MKLSRQPRDPLRGDAHVSSSLVSVVALEGRGHLAVYGDLGGQNLGSSTNATGIQDLAVESRYAVESLPMMHTGATTKTILANSAGQDTLVAMMISSL